MNFLDYILSTKNDYERFDFDSPQDAYSFGTKLREIIAEEGDEESINVEITNTVVRVRVLNPVMV